MRGGSPRGVSETHRRVLDLLAATRPAITERAHERDASPVVVACLVRQRAPDVVAPLRAAEHVDIEAVDHRMVLEMEPSAVGAQAVPGLGNHALRDDAPGEDGDHDGNGPHAT